MKKIFKWFSIAILIIITILIVTNPSPKSFKDFVGEDKEDFIKRERNWLIFSVYGEYSRGEDYPVKYVGIFMNFFELR
jgi:hypothetical protein